MRSFGLPKLSSVVNTKQCRIPGDNKRLTVLIKKKKFEKEAFLPFAPFLIK